MGKTIETGKPTREASKGSDGKELVKRWDSIDDGEPGRPPEPRREGPDDGDSLG